MTMTQRYAGMLRRHAGDWDKRDLPVQAECCRQAARHMEELQAKVDAVQSPWQPMKTAPKDGWGVLVLLDGSDMPHGARWLRGKDDPHATEATEGPGWHLTWDGSPVAEHDDLTIGDEAADEIEHQQLCIRDLNGILNEKRAEIERLRKVLGEIAWSNDTKWQSDAARAALKEPT